jgi:Site-specific recombinases, DNA invertase Pin homologs
MNIAYIRVSTIEQNESKQLDGLEKYNIDKVFKEKVSAKDINRPQLTAMLDFAREGDTIYVWDFSRLVRSTKDLLNIVDQLEMKKIHLRRIKENLDTNTATGKLMLTMIGAINEFERANLLERQKEGIAIAKRQGKFKGRKSIEYPENWNDVYLEWKDRKITGIQAMEKLNLKRNTFYKLLRKYQK